MKKRKQRVVKRNKIKNHKKAQARYLVLKMMKYIIVLLVLMYMFLFIRNSLIKVEYFVVKNVEVLSETVSSAEIFNLYFLDKKVSIFNIPTGDLKNYVLLNHPTIDFVKIKRRFPDKLIIKTYNKIPIAKIYIDNEYYFVTSSGKFYPEYGFQGELIIIDNKGLIESFENYNEKVLDKIVEFITRLKNFKNNDLTNKINKIGYNKEKGFYLFDNNNVQIILGDISGKSIEFRLKYLNMVYEDLSIKERKIKAIDCRDFVTTNDYIIVKK